MFWLDVFWLAAANTIGGVLKENVAVTAKQAVQVRNFMDNQSSLYEGRRAMYRECYTALKRAWTMVVGGGIERSVAVSVAGPEIKGLSETVD